MWTAKAPANIALIKYMGKKAHNIPRNVSLSYTLDKFYTEVSLELTSQCDKYVGKEPLNPEAKKRFVNHLKYIKKIYNCEDFFAISSANHQILEDGSSGNFPHSAGIASSASSFAALTMCTFEAMGDLMGVPIPPVEFQSSVSRIGSGSSCRSFFSPWCLWRDKKAEKISIKIDKLLTDLIIVDDQPKKISSSKAHALVSSSLLMDGREKRAEIRLKNLLAALNNGQWENARQICWEEFWDMNALFETSFPSFGYTQPETIRILMEVRKFWQQNGDGPIATMDAGPNVHLLWQLGQTDLRSFFFRNYVLGNFSCLSQSIA
ncbi:MAG: hypothetical protein LBB12_01910 [Holosporaceae bacterium]|jgi:diphosphomevalonate decarboxylase|nr:hypothetical protein [Holosporaceae bacterium]